MLGRRGGGPFPSVPWVPTRDEVVEEVLRLVSPRPGDVVYDIGCGDGKVAIAFASRYPWARVRCVELRRDLVEKARAGAAEKGVKVEVINADFFEYSFSDADVVYMYLLTTVNQKLRPKLEKELKPGTLIVSLDFPVTGWTPLAVVELPRSWQRTLYIYVAGFSEPAALKKSRGEVAEALRKALQRLRLEALPAPVRERVEGLAKSYGAL